MKLPGAPRADDIAWAFVKAATACGQLERLENRAEDVLAGRYPLHWGWFAVAAIYQVWGPTTARRATAFMERWPGGRRQLAANRASGWWDTTIVSVIARDLIDAHEGG